MSDLSDMKEIIEGLAELGEATEDMCNECFLCGYQPAEGRRINANSGYAPPYAVRKTRVIPDDAYSHEGYEDCLIARAMELKKKFDEKLLKSNKHAPIHQRIR